MLRRLLICCATIIFGATAAWAQPSAGAGWSLDWQAPATCPAADAVRAEVKSLLAGSTQAPEQMSISGAVREQEAGFEVELRFDSVSGPGHRVLSGRACREVTKAAALVIALAIDPGVKIDPNRQSALEEPPAAEPEPVATATASPAKEEPPPREEPPQADHREPGLPVSFEGALGLALELGTLPEPALGPEARLALGLGNLRVALVGQWLPARTYDAEQNTRLRLSVLSAALRLGYALPLGRHALTPEFGLRLGDLAASAQDADAPTTAHSRLLAPELGLRGTFRVSGPLGLWAGLLGGVHLERPRLLVENRGLAHQPGRLWGGASLGVSLHWP